jgi:hypothetical protein
MKNDTPPTEGKDVNLGPNTETPVATVDESDTDYLTLAREAYESSTTYQQANLKKQWERNIANFMSRHPAGSKYRSAAYLHRSRIFRPKTRTAVRQNEAAAVAAFFATTDVVSITAEDSKNKKAVMSADLLMELVNYRLSGSKIPWFKIVIGALQDAQVVGICVGCAEWKYEERENDQDILVGENEDGTLKHEKGVDVIHDQPEVRLVPPENLRLDPGANWLDPVNSSPYLIETIPMYVKDVRARMKEDDPKTGEKKWKNYEDSQLLTAISRESWDSTRQQRENERQDPTDEPTSITGHTMIWVNRVIMELDGIDYQWYTLGVQFLLSDPVPLKKVVLHGMRPYIVGNSVIEAHRNNPSGTVELGQELQAASNDIFNQRFDNVKLALNSRNLVRRSASIDLRALKRSVPGGNVMVGNIEKDVKPLAVKDVTSSSYAEQDRINSDFDEVMGSFSQSSIQSNRKLGETVGGMGMIKDNSNVMSEYVLRTYAETFLENMLRHIVALIREYETDPRILQIAADRAEIPDDTEVTTEMLNHAVDVSVDVGYGATNPVQKLQKFTLAMNTVAVVPSAMARVDEDEVIKEVFGNAGYKNGKKFFKPVEEVKGPPQPDIDQQLEQDKIVVERYGKEIDAYKAQRAADTAENKVLVDRELGLAKLALERDIKLPELYEKLGIKRSEMELKNKDYQLKVLQEMGRREDQAIARRELKLKETTDKQGI